VDVEDKDSDRYYAVARGKVAGIFTDFNEVKKHVRFKLSLLLIVLFLDRRYCLEVAFKKFHLGYPKPLYKKHSTYKEALAYFNKFNKGEEGK
jgi:viroplasmin and RNaseH domain-containing protein